MNIKRGKAFAEHAKAIITEDKFIQENEENEDILLLEGVDDIEVITNYYLYKRNDKNLNFRLLTANDKSLPEHSPVAGKKNALVMHTKLKEKNKNVICLLDRDYDFYFEEDKDKQDCSVKYYDYFELENYLFDEKIFKVVVKNVCKYTNYSEYVAIITMLHEVERACLPYANLCLLRELNYRKNVIEQYQLDKILEIIGVNLDSMMKMDNLGNENQLERISIFIENELEKVNLDINEVNKIIEKDVVNHIYLNEPLELFKYSLKGKKIAKSLPSFFKYLLTENHFLQPADGNLSSIMSRLRDEWLPNMSDKLSELLIDIEKQFTLQKDSLIK